MTIDSGIVRTTPIDSGEPELCFGERVRCAALAASIREAERAAPEAVGIASEASRRFKQYSVEAGRARAVWRGKTAAARSAADAVKEARIAFQKAIGGAYREWKRRYRDTDARSSDKFLMELAQACEMEPRDLLRAIGRSLAQRTPEEREQDFQRYLSGTSMREIARSRGLRMWAIQKDIGKRLAEVRMASLDGGECVSGGRVTTSMLPFGDRPPSGNNRVVGPVESWP